MAVEDSALGFLLRRLRASAGLTQEELAERAGISTRTVSDIERGLRTRIYWDTAGRLAAALGLEGEERSEFEVTARGRRMSRSAPAEAESDLVGGGLPPQPTRLIGRERELERILETLATPGVRLLTLTGPGGIGKSRLAVEAAVRAQPRFKDGVFFVPLGANRDPALVASIVARALRVRQAAEPLTRTIAQHIGTRRLLLVLDTFEQVLDAAPLVAELSAACPGLAVLVTSRAPLHLRGEHELPVPPLEFPELAGSEPIGELGRYPAIALFIERARAVKPDLEIDDELGPAVVDICCKLEGLPLSIELAAARVKHLSLSALRDQLDHRLSFLTRGPRDLPPRHQAMRDTVAWSYELLAPIEQRLFRELSTFAGGWTLEAADAVCAPVEDLGGILSGVSGLVDQSLAFPADPRNDPPRYSMLDVIREYAAEQRDAQEGTEAIRSRHARYFLTLAEEAEPELGRAAQEVWFRRLDADHDNLRVALSWLLERGEAEPAMRLAGALWQFWRRRGDFTEGRRWLETALALEGAEGDRARTKALWGAAWLAYHQWDYERMRQLGEELHASARRAGDLLDVRNALTVLGQVAMAEGRYSEALAPFGEALAICRELDPSWHLATSLLNLGTATVHGGYPSKAESLIEEAIALYRKLGDRFFVARSLGSLGYVRLLQGDRIGAGSLFRSSLEMNRDLRDRWGIAEGLEALSAVTAAGSELDRAARIGGAAEALRESMAVQPMPYDQAVTDGYLAAARALFDESGWLAAWEEGRTMALHRAIEYALEEQFKPTPTNANTIRLPGTSKHPSRRKGKG